MCNEQSCSAIAKCHSSVWPIQRCQLWIESPNYSDFYQLCFYMSSTSCCTHQPPFVPPVLPQIQITRDRWPVSIVLTVTFCKTALSKTSKMTVIHQQSHSTCHYPMLSHSSKYPPTCLHKLRCSLMKLPSSVGRQQPASAASQCRQ